MALFVMVLRKMAKNGWLTVSLLGGLILSVALASSIPIYTEAILQRMLLQDLGQLQQSTGRYPGIHYAEAVMGGTSYWDPGEYKPEDRPQVVRDIDAFMRDEASPGFGLPVDLLVMERKTAYYTIVPADKSRVESETNRRAELAGRSGLYDHIRLVDGRLPAAQPVDGVYEALVVQQSLKAFNMVLGNEFVIEDEDAKTPVRIKPVGVIAKKDDADPYWYRNLETYAQTFFLDFGLYEQEITTGKVMPSTSASWLFALDYSALHLTSVHRFVAASEQIDRFLAQRFHTYSVDAPALATLDSYFEREARLRLTLWCLYAPILIVLAFYLYMVAGLITERQQTEIAVLRSRGASRLQIVGGYVLESALLGAIALAAGPWIGMLLTKVLGASNGFLEFVDRSALPVRVSEMAYRYALYAVAGSMGMTLVPAWLATRSTIVTQMRQKARPEGRSIWHRFYVDLVLIAAALYGLRTFDRQRADWTRLGTDATEISIDPSLFVLPGLFVLGSGLFLLRVYPGFIQLIYRLGRRRWPPVLYSTLLQVGRSGAQYSFVMMFLILTIATGLYSASAARTIGQNAEEKIRYRNGADIVLQQAWISEEAAGGGSAGALAGASAGGMKRMRYVEPSFERFTELPGVRQAARVFVKEDAAFLAGKESGRVRLMGINTAEFGRTAWFRNGLLDHHFNEYLNFIALDPKAVLISRSLADRGIGPGDVIHIDWNGVSAKPFTVYGVIDYWPTFNPNPASTAAGDKGAPQAPLLVVGHLEYIQMALALEPYQVWIKLKEESGRQPFYDAIGASGMKLSSLTDTSEQLIAAKNDPYQLAINGAMTTGFLLAAIVSFLGFLLYWVLSLSGRVMQFGIMRAMGISYAQLVGMLAAEQVLTSGAAVGIGGLVGHWTSVLFVRLFELSFNPAAQVPPFQVAFDPGDPVKLYLIVIVMMGVGLFILGWLLSRIRIHQAVKLGED
ncbi:FtsX-like permease family protein [Paenibacillus sp. HJGM_3]|uniref:ABC transporter permease n=1 Tax=Paenibacillus sp. HJGM_3 TaxID=3379816 RepID=UPI0038595857